MKLYLSADIEGVAGIAMPVETDKGKPGDYAPFQRQMTNEVLAACRGAWAAGVNTVVVKDAHGTGRNLDVHALIAPEQRNLELIRGWSGHPFMMVQGIDQSFDAAAFVGFHSAAGCAGNPLSHTLSGAAFARVELNGEAASEFLLYAYAAASVGVPLVFLSGDAALCEEAQRRIDGLVTVAILRGEGWSTTSITPAESVRSIEEGMRRAMSRVLPRPVPVPPELHLTLVFRKAADAYAKSFYPNARQIDDCTLSFETHDYLAMLTFLTFAAHVG